ncbi:M23 family metallopeptidase [Bradymonas sediminis]|nr:M23 family metallopeptidase [Bradymonas sediminis]
MMLAIGAGLWWWFAERDPEGDKRLEQEVLLARASAVVGESVLAARAPLEVEEADPELGTSKREEQLNAVWVEGEEVEMRGVLKSGESISGVLNARNISTQSIHSVVSATAKEFNFRRSRPGDEWFVRVGADGKINLLRYQSSPEDIWETTRSGDDTYQCVKLEVAVQVREEVIGGVVKSSLWQAVADQGEDGSLIYNFADIFAYTIDFNANTQPGDRFALVFEKVYIEDQFLRYGRVLAGAYTSEGRVYQGFYHQGAEDEGDYYDEKGENMKRQFLKSPLASVRVTSSYGRRFHPVLKKGKMHNGVDYGAPIGTKIRAVADGKVVYAGYKGANGNLIVLSHANGYRTIYAHLSKINKQVRPGKRVSKKQIIGRVGNTGRSTGPHLHFGMKHNGRYIDPSKVDAERGEPLKGSERARFLDDIVEPLSKRLNKALEKTGYKLEAAPINDQPSISAR